jgi:hypothetical protein
MLRLRGGRAVFRAALKHHGNTGWWQRLRRRVEPGEKQQQQTQQHVEQQGPDQHRA